MALIACADGALSLKSRATSGDGSDLASQRLNFLLDGKDLVKLACR